jgi:hypothetical protein
MTHHSSRVFPSLIMFLVGLIVFGSPGLSLAQSYKEVELEVAGPWSYVTDPSDATRIIVISPNLNHLMTVISGGDANGYTGQLEAGIYSLKFQTDPCAKHRPVAPPKMYDIPTTAVPSATSDALGAKNKRVAISLPKPCYYESYLESHLKISTAPIDERTPEGNYTIWMAMHYTILTATTSATLYGTLDSGSPFQPVTLPFNNSTMPPKSSAISVIAYYANVGEDYPCDGHSAEHFDAAMSLWDQTGMYRLFPELDSKANQSHRYNYNTVTCPQAMSKHMDEKMVTAESLRQTILKIRSALSQPNLDTAIKLTQDLKETMFPLWNPSPPIALQNDLNQSLEMLKDLKRRSEAFPKPSISQFLSVTEFLRAPGRADCHAVQLNIDSTVP